MVACEAKNRSGILSEYGHVVAHIVGLGTKKTCQATGLDFDADVVDLDELPSFLGTLIDEGLKLVADILCRLVTFDFSDEWYDAVPHLYFSPMESQCRH